MTKLPLRNRLRASLGRSHRNSILRQRDQFLDAAHRDCFGQQQQTLQNLLQLNDSTDFANDFHLRPGMSISDFQKQIPVAGFDLVRPYIDKVKTGRHQALLGAGNKLLMFALTSGTTAESKLIPVTRQFVSDYRRGWQCWGIGLYFDYPALQPLNMVKIASSHNRFTTADGTPCGNISGLVAAMQSRIVRSMYSVPSSVIDITNAELKRYAALKFAVEDPFVGMMITANPSTVVQMMELMESHTEKLLRDIHDGTFHGAANEQSRMKSNIPKSTPNRKRASELEHAIRQTGILSPEIVWPNLVALGVWCGGSAAAYLKRLKQWFPKTVIRDHGLHASEGRMTMPLQNNSSAGVLEVQTHFFEFLPVDECASDHPATLLAHELQVDKEYFILLTTSSGLYRYNIQDVVRCTGFHGTTPLLEFRHKGAHISSITGEKIAESQVVEAVHRASEMIGCTLRFFTLTPEWSQPPGYVLYVDVASGPMNDTQQRQRFAETVDAILCERNVEYQEKRESDRLAVIRCEAVSGAAWQRFTSSRTAGSGGSIEQYKHPCLLPDPKFENLFRNASGHV